MGYSRECYPASTAAESGRRFRYKVSSVQCMKNNIKRQRNLVVRKSSGLARVQVTPLPLAWFAFGGPEHKSLPTLMFSNSVNDRFWRFFFFRLIWNWRALDLRTRTTRSRRFNVRWKALRKALFYCFSPQRLVRLFILRVVKPSPDSKMIKTSYILITCSRHYDILAKTRSRMTTVITFSRENDAGTRASNT